MDGEGDLSPEHTEIDDQTAAELTALADETIDASAREALERRIAESPVLQRALERQRSGVAAIRTLRVEAPLSLRERVDAERTAPSRPVRRRRLAIAGGLVGAAAAAALAVVLVLPSSSGGPTVVEAAQLAERPAEAEVGVDPANDKFLDTSAEGLPYPNLDLEFGWKPAGDRTDEIEGRDATTVFYERGGERIGYTILSGDSIDPPDGARKTTLNDVALSSTSEGGREIVTWLRDGKTCVLSGEGVSERELLELASWKGDGEVPF
jgi:anti-sigma factor RsiW